MKNRLAITTILVACCSGCSFSPNAPLKLGSDTLGFSRHQSLQITKPSTRFETPGIISDEELNSSRLLASQVNKNPAPTTVRGQDHDFQPSGPLKTNDATQPAAYTVAQNGNPNGVRVAQLPSGDPYTAAPNIFPTTPTQQHTLPEGSGQQPIHLPGMNGFGQPGLVGPSLPQNFGNYADITARVSEGQSGQIMIGAAVNSDAGITGQLTISEKNFDITRVPRNWRELFIDQTAFRGAGQGFRLEAMPGSQVQRYLASFTEPYLFNTPISLSSSAYYFTRNYLDWNEQRLGGRVSLGYRLTPDLSLSVGTRMENVKIFDPRLNTSNELNRALGNNSVFIGNVTLTHDTRDHPFLATEGHYLELGFQQGFGEFDFPRAEIDYRRYFLLSQRPDGSGRHTLSATTKLGFSGPDTPIFENYFAGGFSTIRGFDFRGASPVENGVQVGGEFSWLSSVEYMFPLRGDDMVRGVIFCDFGTVEEKIDIDFDDFRVAPGFGFRVNMPFAGSGGAPLAFDFTFPVSKESTDVTRMFSFHMGVGR